MPTSDYAYDWNGFVFGTGTSTTVQKATGLHDLPLITSDDTDYETRHGAAAGVSRMGKRVIEMDLWVEGSRGTDIENKIAAVKAAFQPPRIRKPRDLKQFKMKRPGQAERYVYAKVTKRDLPSTYDAANGLWTGSVQFTAPDPVWYDITQKTLSVSLANTVLTGSNSGTNSGDHADGVKPELFITGPARNPRIQNTTDDSRTIRIDIDIQANRKLYVNLATRQVELWDLTNVWQSDQFSAVRLDNQWWDFLPGSNTIVFTRDGTALTGAGALLEVKWRDGWT